MRGFHLCLGAPDARRPVIAFTTERQRALSLWGSYHVLCHDFTNLSLHINLTVAMRKSGLQSAADLFLQDPAAAICVHISPNLLMLTNAQGPIAGKPVAEKKSRTAKSTLQKTASAMSRSRSRSTKNPMHISTPAPFPTQKPLPKALWTPVRTHLSLQGAEARIYIHEFALHFLPLSCSYHDELKVLSCSQ